MGMMECVAYCHKMALHPSNDSEASFKSEAKPPGDGTQMKSNDEHTAERG